MSRIAYYRVSTQDQSIASQRSALGGVFDKEFIDEGVSGATCAATRPGFKELLSYVREGDTVCVYAVDRLGRDALDVQSTVRQLILQGVIVDIHGLGPIGKGVGELILAVLAQVVRRRPRPHRLDEHQPDSTHARADRPDPAAGKRFMDHRRGAGQLLELSNACGEIPHHIRHVMERVHA
jgi:putative DNA-invertase from lambdoid prophage Rac